MRNVSFVLVSPSMLILLKVSAATPRRNCDKPGPQIASVTTKASIVAMFGWIIPAPFATERTAVQVPSRHDTGCRDDLVRSEDTFGETWTIRNDQRDIQPARLSITYASGCRADSKAHQIACGLRPLVVADYGHRGSASRPIVSG